MSVRGPLGSCLNLSFHCRTHSSWTALKSLPWLGGSLPSPSTLRNGICVFFRAAEPGFRAAPWRRAWNFCWHRHARYQTLLKFGTKTHRRALHSGPLRTVHANRCKREKPLMRPAYTCANSQSAYSLRHFATAARAAPPTWGTRVTPHALGARLRRTRQPVGCKN